jgi:hypothetical protein
MAQSAPSALQLRRELQRELVGNLSWSLSRGGCPLAVFVIERDVMYTDFRKNPVDGFSAGLVDDDNIYEWEITIFGQVLCASRPLGTLSVSVWAGLPATSRVHACVPVEDHPVRAAVTAAPRLPESLSPLRFWIAAELTF